jgi:hypothetical protein
MVTSDHVELSQQIDFMIRYFTFTSFDWEKLRKKVVNIACFLAHVTIQAHEQIPEPHKHKIYNVSYYFIWSIIRELINYILVVVVVVVVVIVVVEVVVTKTCTPSYIN